MSIHRGGKGAAHVCRQPYSVFTNPPTPGATRVTTDGDVRATTTAQQRALT